MKNQALFSWKDKSKKLKCRLLQFLFGASRVKMSWARFKTNGDVLNVSLNFQKLIYEIRQYFFVEKI